MVDRAKANRFIFYLITSELPNSCQNLSNWYVAKDMWTNIAETKLNIFMVQKPELTSGHTLPAAATLLHGKLTLFKALWVAWYENFFFKYQKGFLVI